jgi:hypothetical protein
MQSPNNTSGGYSNQRPQQTSPSSTGTTGYVDHSGQPMGYHSVAQSAQAQRSTYGHPQDLQHLRTPTPSPNYSRLISLQISVVAGDPSGLASNTPQQTGQFVNPQYPQYSASSTHAMGVSLNPGIPTHFQNYHPIEHGQPIVPSQYRAHSATPQNPYPNPAMQTRGGHAQYLDPATGMGPSPATSGHSSPSSSTSSSNPLTCDICGAPFTLPQNLKRHHESQHTTMEHVCPYCQKRFTRVDSLKRHVDRPCSQMPRAPPEGAA